MMATCKGCGAEITWAVSRNRKRLPLDAKYEMRCIMVGRQVGDGAMIVEVVPTYTSHFATCPKADEFRKGA